MATVTAETSALLASARAHLPGGGIWTFSTRPSGFGSSLDAPDFLIERGDEDEQRIGAVRPDHSAATFLALMEWQRRR